MRVLAITKLFPNAADPLAAPFNRQQLSALGALCELRVMATIPWFPGAHMLRRWSTAGRLARVPAREVISGLEVTHPRTLYLPRAALATWGPLYAASIAPAIAGLRGQIDVVLGAWAYPDGYGAVLAARLLGVPCVVKVHGSDLHLVARRRGARGMTRWGLTRASRVVAVSRPLAHEAIALGVAPERVSIVRNGVDGALFRPRDRQAARAALALADGPIALYAGNLKHEKGILDLARAWPEVARTLPTATLVVVGDGPLGGELSAATNHLGPRVRLVRRQPLDQIPLYMAAANVLALPSHSEGTPNVVLEALACGRRVVATRVGGVPELISSDLLGELVPARDPGALAGALVRALRTPYDAEALARVRPHAGWDASARALHAVLAGVAQQP